MRSPRFTEMLSALPGARARRILPVDDTMRSGRVFFLDLDYGLTLGAVTMQQLSRANTDREVLALVEEACREPTSLELLTYAQLTGPHITGRLPGEVFL